MENYNLESARELVNSAEKELSKEFEKAEEICEFNSEKVLKAPTYELNEYAPNFIGEYYEVSSLYEVAYFTNEI